MNESSWLFLLRSPFAGIVAGVMTLAAASSAYAATEGERCGRAGSWSATCDEGLECDVRWKFWRWSVGVCVAPVTQTACGARAGDTCAPDEFCSFTLAANCGRADATGVCEPRPEVCTEEYAPVCGCNGFTYDNACEANAAGVGILDNRPCPECDIDEDCESGYCDIGVTCAAIGCPPPPPNRCTVCGDGTRLLCRRAPPECPEGLVPEIVNSCYGDCVDRFSCAAPGTCEYNGVIYQAGEGFKADDGCNDCGCQEDGSVFCTLKLCVCDYSDPARIWVSKDREECTRIDYLCDPASVPFTDACGCGCQPLDGTSAAPTQ